MVLEHIEVLRVPVSVALAVLIMLSHVSWVSRERYDMLARCFWLVRHPFCSLMPCLSAPAAVAYILKGQVGKCGLDSFEVSSKFLNNKGEYAGDEIREYYRG